MSEVFLVGRPNVGKSFLFNELTGSNQKIGNFAGVTVDKKTRAMTNSDLLITDLPGIYTLNAKSNDEKVALNHLTQSSPEDLICLVIECLKFKTQLPYILELRNWCAKNYRPMILCLNMKDEADKFGIEFNLTDLQKNLGLPVFLVSAKTKEGLGPLQNFFKSKTWSAPESLNSKNINSETKTPISEAQSSQIYEAHDTQLIQNLKQAVQGDFSKVLAGQNRLDTFFLSPVVGPLIFLFFTFMLFQSIFSWSEPFMNFVEFLIGSISELVSPYFSGHSRSFLDNAVFAGFGAFLVFTPQIFMLTFILTFLEKSGYMARAVLICHQPLSWFCLHGKSFIPMMTGHACAVPAIYTTRSIENQRVRKLTIFILPLTVCSARIPVYALLIKVLIPNKTILFGVFGLQGFVFFMMYFFGLLLALIVSALVTKWANKAAINDNFIVELPQYRWPELKSMTLKGLSTTWDFIKDAGPIIFTLNAGIWLLSYLPSGSADLKSSYLARAGKFLEPIFTPIGLDWLQGVAVLSSFVAREVFVSTLGLLYGLSAENSDEVINIEQIQNISLASGLSLLCFFAIALQCMSTVSVMAKETSSKLAFTALGFYLVIAYFFSFCIYQTLS